MPDRPAIRPARADDLGRLGPLYERAGFGARLAGVVGFAKARLDGEVVVADAGGELVGVAAGAVFAGTGWVGGVAVVPAHRRVGLGGALAIVAYLEDRGRPPSCCTPPPSAAPSTSASASSPRPPTSP